MKTPEEIKKGLECCHDVVKCEQCPYKQECDLPFGDVVEADALAYIHMLEADKKILEIEKEEFIQLSYRLDAERDALIKYLTDSHVAPCDICKHDTGEGVMGCKHIREVGFPCFEWRGLCNENGGE